MRPVAVLLLLAAAGSAWASCEGQGCAEQAAAARAAGLLGGSAQQLRSCAPRTFPTQGSLEAVSPGTRINDLRWAAGPNGSVNDKYIFALTMDVDGFPGGAMWRSDNSGAPASWADATPNIAASLPAGNTTLTGVVDLVWHESRPDRILFQGKGRFHFLSLDYGATFKALPTPGGTEGFSHEVRLHPRQPDWLLAKVRRNECLADRRSPACAYDLFLSQDFAASWKNLTEQSAGRVASFRDFDWGCKMDRFAGKPTPDEAIFATLYAGPAAGGSRGKGLYPGWDKDLHYAVSLDFFKTPVAKMVPCGNLFEIVARKVYLAVPSECPVGPDGKARKAPKAGITGRSVTMYVSDEDGDEFSEVCLPVNLEDDGYNMIHTHDNWAAFILADHAEPGSKGPSADSPTSDAYAPAYNASFFTVSLRSVYRREFITDFVRVEGIPGMFVANQVDEAAMGAATSYTDFLQTRLTLNGGSDWQALPKPERFTYAQCNACKPGAPDEQCRLHLHGPTSWFAPEGARPNLYTHDAAPGLVLATGNVGAHLDFQSGASCTFLSRDAGLTWEDVADYAGIYEFGNNGGLIVMAPHKSEGPSDVVQFSSDNGACWHTVKLPEPIMVDNIRVDPKGAGHTFLVHGAACLKSTTKPNCTFTGGGAPPAKMFVIDVKDLLGSDWRDCNAAEGSADYEAWQVPRPDTCLLGARYSMVRRKRDAACFNTGSYTPAVAKQGTCECTLADTECEFGWQRNGTTCAKMPDLHCMDTCPSMMNSGYAVSSTHLRLIHADQCTGVGAIIPDTDGRGNGGGGKGGGGGGGGGSAIKSFFLFVLVTGILVVVAGVVWAHCLPDHLKDRALDVLAPLAGLAAVAFETVLDGIITAWDWLRAKFAGAGQRSAAEAAYFEPLAEVDPEDHRSPPLFPGRLQTLEFSNAKVVRSAHSGGVTALDLDPTEQRYLLAGAADASVAIYDTQQASNAEALGAAQAAQAAAGAAAALTGARAPRASAQAAAAGANAEASEHAALLAIGKQAPGAHKYSVSAVAWYPVDSGLFVTGGYDSEVKVWDANCAAVAHTFSLAARVYAAAMSPIATAHCSVAVGSGDTEVKLCDIVSGAFTHTLSGHRAAVWALHWSPSSEWQLVTGGCDGQLRLWDIRRPGPLHIFDQHDTQQQHEQRQQQQRERQQEQSQQQAAQPGRGERRQDVQQPAAGRGVQRQGSASRQRGLQRSGSGGGAEATPAAGAGSGSERMFLPEKVTKYSTAHAGSITGIVPTPDGLHWVSAGTDDRLRLWDAASYRHALVHYPGAYNHAQRGRQLAVSDDSSTLFFPSGSVLQMYDTGSGGLLRTLAGGHFDTINCCRWNGAAQELYTGGDDCNIVVWAPAPERVTAEREPWQQGDSDGDAWSD